MPGSRKGERRGGARFGGGVKKGPHETKFNRKTGKITPKPKPAGPGRPPGPSVMTEENKRKMLEIITGQRELMPKDMLLNISRTLYAEAKAWENLREFRMAQVPGDHKQREELNLAVAEASREMRDYYLLTAQVARDAARYYHPQLSAIAHHNAPADAGDLFDQLMKEIDQTPRLRVIEHRKNEDEEAA